MFIKNSYDFEILPNLTSNHVNNCESIFIELKHPSKQNIIIGTIYRHPNNYEDFFEHFLDNALNIITKSKRTCILAGDFNVDLTQYGANSTVNEFYDEITGSSFRPLILQPTRATSHSLTLIDNIFINNLSISGCGGNLTTSISDHFCQFTFLDIFNNSYAEKKVHYARNWRIFNKN